MCHMEEGRGGQGGEGANAVRGWRLSCAAIPSQARAWLDASGVSCRLSKR